MCRDDENGPMVQTMLRAYKMKDSIFRANAEEI
jgi:hypothetical protein